MKPSEAVNLMYEAAVSALCHCDDNPAGMYPGVQTPCGCKQTKKVDEALRMLRNVRSELIAKLTS